MSYILFEMTGINLQTPIAYVNGIGPSKSEVLASELGIHRVGDLIHHFPFRYVDRSRFFR